MIRFPVYATRPNIIIEGQKLLVTSKQIVDLEGWFCSDENPEDIVRGFSHLRIKKGFKLRGYCFRGGIGGNGVVWAIPEERELEIPDEIIFGDQSLFNPPKPTFALSDTMEAIEGDGTPLAYLQAAIVFHEFQEFGAYWHGVSWGSHTILPLDNIPRRRRVEMEHIVWDMKEKEPDFWDPVFYYSNDGHPVVCFYTICDMFRISINRFTHRFSKQNYTLDVTIDQIADGGMGAIP